MKIDIQTENDGAHNIYALTMFIYSKCEHNG